MDTRKLARSIRDLGSRRALITSPDTPTETALAVIAATPVPRDAVSRVSCKKRWYSRTADAQFHVVAVDCGIKLNIIRSLNHWGCNVTIVPYNTTAEEILFMKPDGVFLSNGPGDPEDVPEVAETVRKLRGKVPIFGICLGHQILSLAYGKIEMTAQNHSYALIPESVEGTGLTVTHVNLLDNTIEGVECRKDRIFGIQYHPESAPGPQDSQYLFAHFVDYMKEAKGNAEKNRY